MVQAASAAVSAATEAAVVSAAPQPAVVAAGRVRGNAAAPQADAVGSSINSLVNGAFDALANWLSSLPPNPISDVVGGALLLVRRSLFNQAPTAVPVQWGQTSTNIVGSIGATDLEGDPIVYTVVSQPTHGTIEIDATTGDYTYTPAAFDSDGGSDEFTVRLTDSGFHLNLLGASSTDVTVPITISPVEIPQASYTRGFDIYNWTSKTLVYLRYERNAPASGPDFQSQFKPGESAHFEVTYDFWDLNVSRVVFEAADGTGLWAVDMAVYANIQGKAVTQACYASGSNRCSDRPFKVSFPLPEGEPVAYFMDAPGTTINVTGVDKQKQATWLNSLCFNGSSARCTFTINKDKSDVGGLNSKNYTGWKEVASVTNSMSKDQRYTREVSSSYSAETSWSLTASLKAALFDKLLEAGISGTYGQKWSLTESFKDTFILDIPAGETAYIYVRNPVRTLIGDFTLKLGNTTWNLSDVEFFYPDPARASNVEVTFTRKVSGEAALVG